MNEVNSDLGVGLLGMGVVGTAVAATLIGRAEEFAKHTGKNLKLHKVVVRDLDRQREIELPEDTLSNDVDAVLENSDIEIVVEVMGGLDPAGQYIRRALAAGKHVVTANKELIAKEGPDLFEIARKNGSSLHFEASVAGAIPAIHPQLRDLRANKIKSITGIINGTTNYILTNMVQKGMAFDNVLSEAQSLGYAESDPTSDVEGYDAAYKIAILASLAFDQRVSPDDVITEGISKIEPKDLEDAAERGYAVKLLAIAEQKEDGCLVRVDPTLLPEQTPLAKIDGVQNAIQILGDLSGPLTFQGAGAGGSATASAVISDVLEVARALAIGNAPLWDSGIQGEGDILTLESLETRYYLRLLVSDRSGVLARVGDVFVEKILSIAAVYQKEIHAQEDVAELVIMTHKASEASLNEAIGMLSQIPDVHAVNNRIRVED